MMLKRTGFKRAAFERTPRAPIAPVENCRGVIRAVGDVVLTQPKEIVLRSRDYRMWVATQWPCDFCGVAGFGQCAHENLGKAMQRKVCDSRAFNACGPHWGLMGCHYAYDNYIDISREEARELGARLSARMRERAVETGWQFTNTEIVKP